MTPEETFKVLKRKLLEVRIKEDFKRLRVMAATSPMAAIKWRWVREMTSIMEREHSIVVVCWSDILDEPVIFGEFEVTDRQIGIIQSGCPVMKASK